VFKDLNIIFSATMIGASMEVTSVFITIDCSPYFSSLFPSQQAGLGTSAENRDNNSTKSQFRGTEDPMFLDEVKQVNNDFAVRVLLVDVSIAAFPFF
jgi:hypothetical protein